MIILSKSMIQYFIQNLFNFTLHEAPRVLYAWTLRFFINFGRILGWTAVVAAVVTRFSIVALPVIFLIQAVFTIVGMFLFSVLVERLSAKQIILLSTIFGIITLFCAFLFYGNDIAFVVLTLIASGLFLSQTSIIISNYLEDFFSPLEAERIVPTIDSAKTVSGILGGIVLAVVGSYFSVDLFILLWVFSLIFFLVVLFLINPALPFYLKKLDEESHKKYLIGDQWNALVKGVKEIKKVPFLQILLIVLFFHWIIAHFIEFLYTKAVEDSVHISTVSEHEASLVHGLGALQVFFHMSALFVQFFLSGRLMKSLGTFSGFIIHAVVTFLGAISMLFGYGYFFAAFVRNNFEMTSIIQENAYESSYYAFKYGTLRSLREFFEGIVAPVATIVSTLLIIFIEFFFLEQHFMYIVPFILVSLSIFMGIFSFQLQGKYTSMAISNLYSKIPLARHHAVEIMSQRGHKSSYDHLLKLFNTHDDKALRKKVVYSLAHLADVRGVDLLMNLLKGDDKYYWRSALESISSFAFNMKKKQISDDLRSDIVLQLKMFIRNHSDEDLRALAVHAIASYDPFALFEYLNSEDVVLVAESCIALWGRRINRSKIRTFVKSLLDADDDYSFHVLVRMAGKVKVKGLFNVLINNVDSPDPVRRLLTYYGLFVGGKLKHVSELTNLLLFGNEVVFSKGLELVRMLSPMQKRRIAHFLMPLEQLKYLPDTVDGKKMFNRVNYLYDACDAHDERSYLHALVPQSLGLNNVF